MVNANELNDLWTGAPELAHQARLDIVKAATWMIERSYVHIVQKRAMYAIDPLQRLRLLQQQLEEDQKTKAKLGSDLAFHCELIELFTSLRDLHTNYLLPSPYREKTVVLPLLIEEIGEEDARQYLVTKLLDAARTATFKEGVLVRDWNGVPIERALALLAARQAGANAAARHACALHTLTIRPLIRALPPDEDWVVLGYSDERGVRQEIKLRWTVLPPEEGEASAPAGTDLATGSDLQAGKIQQARKRLFAPAVLIAEQRARKDRTPRAAGGDLPTTLPSILRAQELPPLRRGGEAFGYLRIFTFDVPDADELVAEVARLVEQLPRAGLILDVRGNGGGLIWAAERLLQVFTARRIEPERFQFTSSPLTLAMCRRFDDLQPWSDSLALAVKSGAMYSNSFPVTEEATCNAFGQRYFGPVVLITDGICFSATDMFAAGFRDHDIGPILGASGNTGAGGANVWTFTQLRELASLTEQRAPEALPAGVEMRVAIRRSLRVGKNAGVPVEDFGIVPDVEHVMTRRDVLEGNVDLLERAKELLRPRSRRWLALRTAKRERRLLRLQIDAVGIHSLEALVNERLQRTLKLAKGKAELMLRSPSDGECTIELRGYGENDELLARYRLVM